MYISEMQAPPPVDNQLLVTRDSARDYILRYFITSEYLLPGDRLNLPFFAKRLDCSVTPLREALSQLSQSGLVRVEHNRGFHVAGLQEKEAQKILQAIIGLESQAIRAALPGQLNYRSLATANEAITDALSPAERFFADVHFHNALTSYFAGTHIVHLLYEMKVRLYFYMREYLSDNEHAHQMIATHTRIIRCLESSDKEGAILALQQNWLDTKLSF